MYLHLPLGFFFTNNNVQNYNQKPFHEYTYAIFDLVNRCYSTTRTFLLTKHGKKNYFIFLIPKKYF